MKRRTNPLLILVLSAIIFFASLFSFPVRAEPGIIYVATAGNCGGATPCYNTIQDAVNAAVSDDEIRVAMGTYSGVSTRDGITAVVRIVDKKITLQSTPWD